MRDCDFEHSFGDWTKVKIPSEIKPPLKIYKSSYGFFLFSDDVCMIMKFLSNSPICHMTANTFPQLPNPSVVTLTANQHFAVNRWNTNYSGMKQKQILITLK